MDSHIYTDLVLVSSRVMRKLIREAMPGESATDLGALALLEQNSNIPMSTFALQFGTSQPAVTKVVNKLAGQGFISKNKSPNDMRQTLIAITPKGLEFLQAQRMIAAQYLEKLFHSLNEEDLAAIRRSVEILKNKVDDPR
ncbi:MAG: MarR family transcriptional regulator [Corynebacterium sp.]|nr:MarR family transcriptional regulator [Corynebacterium sp.]